MKTIYENSVNYLELNIQDENPADCISSITCDDTSLVSIANDNVLHKFIITTNTLPVGINSKLVKFTYSITDNNNNTNESCEYFLVLRKSSSNNSNLDNLSDFNITHEDLVYYTILDSVDYLKCYYDDFRKFPSLDKISELVYDQTNTSYNGIANSYLTKVVLDNSTSSYNSFMIHIQSDDNSLFDIKYSINNEVSWVTLNNDELDNRVDIPAGFTSLSIKISWLNNATLNSFGIFYDSTNDVWY